jgi:hypothetical protein
VLCREPSMQNTHQAAEAPVKVPFDAVTMNLREFGKTTCSSGEPRFSSVHASSQEAR